MNIQEINQFIFSLRKTKKKVTSNYYLTLQKSNDDFEVWKTESSIVFLAQENKVLRCFFATIDFKDLNKLLRKVPKDTVMDYISKEEMDVFPWEESGFKYYTTLMRFTNPDLFAASEKTKRQKFLEQFYDENFGEFATETDVDELYDLLYKVFDCRVSRLPSKEELLEQIQKNWVLLYREDGEIIAFLMYQIEGRKYYGYQIYNTGTADITYNLERRATKYAIEHYDVKSSYAWIEVGNHGANARIELNADGVRDYIFVKR